MALVGLLNGYPYEIFTGLADDDDGIYIPKNVTTGKIIKQKPDQAKKLRNRNLDRAKELCKQYVRKTTGMNL